MDGMNPRFIVRALLVLLSVSFCMPMTSQGIRYLLRTEYRLNFGIVGEVL